MPATTDDDAFDHTLDDDRKVFVSRLPKRWDDATLALHFSNIFGPVESATIRQEQKIDASESKACYVCGAVGHVSRECSQNPEQGSFVPAPTVSRGFGFVVFVETTSKQKALAQRTIHVQQRTIQIREVARNEVAEWSGGGGGSGGGASSEAGGGGVAGVVGRCFLWEQFACPRGDACKFSHDGAGGCVKVSAPGAGVAKCLSFKKKGRCSKGDQCPFRHVAREPSSMAAAKAKDLVDSGAPTSALYGNDSSGGVGEGGGGEGGSSGDADGAPAPVKLPGICDSWKKKGKCRKGDRCRYRHATVPTGKAATGTHTKFGGDDSGIEDATKEDHGEGSSKKRRKIDGLALIHAKSAVVK